MPARPTAIDVRVESLLTSPKSTAAPTHDTTAVSDSIAGSHKTSERWRWEGATPSRTQLTARPNSTTLSGMATSTMVPK